MKLLLKGVCSELFDEIKKIPSGLYLFEVRNDYCKFGKSDKLFDRVSQHYCYNKEGRISIFDGEDNLSVNERLILKKLNKYKKKNEWIYHSFDEVSMFIEGLNQEELNKKEVKAKPVKKKKEKLIIPRFEPVPLPIDNFKEFCQNRFKYWE